MEYSHSPINTNSFSIILREIAARGIQTLLVLSFVAFLAQCTSTPTPDLDPDKIDLTSKDHVKVDWKNFFKPPPTAEERKQLEKSIAQWENTTDPKVLLDKARAEMAVGHNSNAEATLLNLTRRESENLEGYLELINLYLKLGRISDASDIMNILSDKVSKSPEVISMISKDVILKVKYLKAMILIAQESKADGRKMLSELIGEIPGFTPAYVALGQSYLSTGNVNLAEFVITRALDRIKNNAELFNLAGIVFLADGQNEKAADMFENSLALNKTYPPALINRANLNINQGNYSSAEEDLMHASKIDPLNPDALVSLGNLYLKQGNFQNAKSAYTQALDIRPSHIYARFNLAIVNIKHLNNISDAKQLLNEVLQTPHAPIQLKNQAKSHLTKISNLEGI